MMKNIYEGIWNGKEVLFNKKVGGYYLSDKECDALCQNKLVPIYDKSNQTAYVGKLEERRIGFDCYYRVANVYNIPFNSKETIESVNSEQKEENLVLDDDTLFAIRSLEDDSSSIGKTINKSIKEVSSKPVVKLDVSNLVDLTDGEDEASLEKENVIKVMRNLELFEDLTVPESQREEVDAVYDYDVYDVWYISYKDESGLPF